MLTGDDIKQARQRAGLSQAELAQRVGVSMRSVGNYERGETVPRNKMPRIKETLAAYLDDADGPALIGASDAELLAEIARRFEKGHHDGTATIRAGGRPASSRRAGPSRTARSADEAPAAKPRGGTDRDQR